MYTHTDEAPMLATYSLLPVLRAYCRFAGVKIMKKEHSLTVLSPESLDVGPARKSEP